MRLSLLRQFSALTFLLVTTAAQAGVVPVELRCEARLNPLGIGVVKPGLSWRLEATVAAERGQQQSAYRILVASTPQTLAADQGDLWDSGKIVSPETVNVIYSGQTLTSGQRCYWKVRVYDGTDQASAWSAPAQWSMGLLAATNWTAQWIGFDAAYSPSPQQATNDALFNTAGVNWVRFPQAQNQAGINHAAFRKQIVLPANQTITNAVLALHADNECVAYVNGQALTNSVKRWEATTRLNVTPWLRAGTNVLALAATNSDSLSARVIGRLVVQFASGSISNLPVDTSWKVAQNPPATWAQTNFNDAAWVTAESTSSPWGTPALNDVARVPAAYLRKEFVLGQAVTRATAYVTALGAYELRLNGQKVGNDVLTPGWTEFTRRVHHQTYDVTGLVQSGANTIGAILGDGWYASTLAFKGRRLNYGGTPRLLVQVMVELADGSTQIIGGDGSWQASYGPIRFADLLLGSEYDARLEMPGWDTTNFNASAWSPVTVGLSAAANGYFDVTALVTGLVTNQQLNFPVNNTTMGGDPIYGVVKTLRLTYQLGGIVSTQSFAENTTVILGSGGQPLTVLHALYGNASQFPGSGGLQVQPASAEPSRVIETIAAVQMTEPKPGCYTFDLGQNLVGWLRLNVSGAAGQRITVRHGEMLNPDGTIYTASLRGANATDFFIFATNGVTVFEPRFTFHGFRYVEISGLSAPPPLHSVTGVVVHSDMPQTGSFASSSQLLNQLFHNIIWGQKGNYLEVPTDCPQRDERLGWTGDTQFFVPTAAYNFDVQSFFRRYLVTLCQDAQQADGSYAHVAPDLGAGARSAAWGDAAWITPYVMYRTYGDTNVIAEHYAALQRYGLFLAANASNYAIDGLPGDFGDWLNLGGGATKKVVATAYYAYYAQAMSEMAQAIGRPADAASYAGLRNNIVAAFANFFNADGSFKDGSSQTGYALAFTLHLVPESLRPQVAQKFAASIAQFNNHLATGFIGTPRLLPALHLAGRDDLAYTLLLQESYPSWLYQVTLGATTMWERWDGWTPTGGFQDVGMNSFNHYAFGSVGEYLYSVVGGISARSPGYRTIKIQPVPGNGLTWANTSYQSVRGMISTAWTNTGNTFKLTTVIPPNTTAHVYLPTTNTGAITESGALAATAPGVSFVGLSNNCAVYEVGSGTYFWSAPLPALPPSASIKITTTNQVASANATFTPGWAVLTNGSLIAGKLPVSASGNFSLEPHMGVRDVKSLTDGGSLTISTVTNPKTTSTNYVTCGNGGGAGSAVIYSLGDAPNGYDLTNIVVYGGWGDNGRDQQAYTIYYAIAAAPTNFLLLTFVNLNPPAPNDRPSATRVEITSSNSVIAGSVATLKFDFTSPGSENGYCGYAELTAFGTASTSPVVPTILSVSPLTPAQGFVFHVSGLTVGQNYQLQSTTNLTAPNWLTETSFSPAASILVFTNLMLMNKQKFFRVVGF